MAKQSKQRKKNPAIRTRIFQSAGFWRWKITDNKGREYFDGGNYHTKDEAKEGLAAAVAYLTRDRDDERKKNPIKGPGKFEGGTYAGRYAYENVDDELGSVQDFGWYGNFSGKIKGRGPFHIIVREDSQGFVYGEFFDTEKAMRKAWGRLEKEYEDFENEISEREGED